VDTEGTTDPGGPRSRVPRSAVEEGGTRCRSMIPRRGSVKLTPGGRAAANDQGRRPHGGGEERGEGGVLMVYMCIKLRFDCKQTNPPS
jgi:hypothetical protein